jgi:ABC-2 type transport system ATP-binding protein
MEIISIKGVNKSFKRKKILEDINLSINKGEIVGIIGPSGCGKSVLTKILIGFLKPDSGKILFNPNLKKEIGFSMQNNSIYDYLTIRQNFKYFAKMYNIPRKKRKEAIPEIMNKLNLIEFEKTIVRKLSGGTQKRVDIGCALLNDPNILILDEPFVGLDSDLIDKISKFLLLLNKKGVTIIISSHRTNELTLICSRFALIKNKKLQLINKKRYL